MTRSVIAVPAFALLMVTGAVPVWAASGLRFIGALFEGITDGLAGANSVAVSPDGVHVYVAGYDDDAVALFTRNTGTGVLSFVEAKKNGIDGVDGLAGASAVVVSPDGAHVYATGGPGDALAVFSRNATTGTLTFVEVKKDGVGGVDGLDAAWSIAVSPDGAHVYATGYVDNAVAVFSRNPTTVDHCDGTAVTGELCVTSDVGPHCATDADCTATPSMPYCISNGFCGGPGNAATCRALCP